MNRLVTTNLRGVSPASLPPPERRQQTRILFLAPTTLGFGNYHRTLIDYVARDDEIDAVHIEMVPPLWMKVVGKSLPPINRWRLDFHATRYFFLMKWQLRRWFAGALDPTRFDVIHMTTQEFSGGLMALANQETPKLAVNIDACELQPTRSHRRRLPEHPVMASLERRLFRACDLIVCRNAWAAEGLRTLYNCPENKIHIALNGLHPPTNHRQMYPPRAKGELVRLCFVGNAFKRKGGFELLNLHQQHFADVAELHIFSGGARPFHDLRNVVWHGKVDRHRLLEEQLPTMDLFVFPTTSDMAPWAITEAAGAGLPVVTTRMAGIPEIVRDGVNGMLCEPKDWPAFAGAIDHLIRNPALRSQMGSAGREHIQRNYNPDAHFGGLLERLKTLANDPASWPSASDGVRPCPQPVQSSS